MKLRYKISIIFILFFFFIILNNIESLAFSDSLIEYCKTEAENQLDSYYDSYVLLDNNGNAIQVVLFNSSVCSPVKVNTLFQLEHTTSISYKLCDYRSTSSSSNYTLYESKHDGTKTYKLTNIGGREPIFSTVTVYYYETWTSPGYFSYSHAVDVFLEGTKPEPDKINLFTLNLHDLDYDGQVHTFNLSTYTDDVFYDDIMECYNKDFRYAIFLTDYTRTLTYKYRDNDSSFLYGAYTISGYIDFLTTDSSYFYYSKYHGKYFTSSGTTLFDTDPACYTRRFYFNVVYSEDSNDPVCVAWYDNGVLSEVIEYDCPENYCFIGSSQTICYAVEGNNGKFKGLSDNIRNLGYYSPSCKKCKTIMDDENWQSYITDLYTYDFNFAGGTTVLLFSTDSTYEQDIGNRYIELSSKHSESNTNSDSSDGMSYSQGCDFRTSSFEEGEVTNNTSFEEDTEHIGEIIPATTIKHDDDDSDWGILDYLSYFFNKDKSNQLDATNSSNNINNTVNTVKDKFSFTDNIVQNANDIKDYIINTQETHQYYIYINSKYLSGNVCIIDLSWYEPYKPTVDSLICAFAYLAFIWHVFCNIPSLISGASIVNYSGDIQAYKNTGFGRSSNIHKGGF